MLLIYWSAVTIPPTGNGGCLGSGRDIDSLPKRATTFDMVGLTAGSSCTHKSPMCMHLTTCGIELDFINKGSTNSISLPSFHSCHTCNQFQLKTVYNLTFIIITSIWSKISILVSSYIKHTYARSVWACPVRWKPLFLLPLMISSTITPKLKTSDFTENSPSIAYSGAMYPLFQMRKNNYTAWLK